MAIEASEDKRIIGIREHRREFFKAFRALQGSGYKMYDDINKPWSESSFIDREPDYLFIIKELPPDFSLFSRLWKICRWSENHIAYYGDDELLLDELKKICDLIEKSSEIQVKCFIESSRRKYISTTERAFSFLPHFTFP